ncbi:aminoglycoside 6-adenylyltransferase [Shinella sp. G-2]|uniref:aminoglycoside 6-adenylyltransferase n=1 Tax=Shinella sp. G-2 TaxID=3133141 RepID=UPI003D003248
MIMSCRDAILSAIQAFAERSPLVDALVLTGSLARMDGSADALSDIDVEFVSSDPAALGREDGWLREIGPLVTVLRLEPDGDQDWATRLAIYEDGTKVDFTLAGRERIAAMRRDGELDALYERGYRVLLDKPGLTAGLPAAGGGFPAVELPSAEAYRAAVEEFWFEAVHIPKYLARGELWLVKERDGTMKSLLLAMMEWHAAATAAAPVDTWHIGTRLRQWVDPRTWDDLQETFGRFDRDDTERAFVATTALYGRLARTVAQKLGYTYPADVEKAIRRIASTRS